ncbi:MAG: PEP-CTERM sorting domain-containing protein [Pirellulales bacterium]|nr:PEP-CTERM sorting domain-containing protein [Pirellulales bacterium]
MIRHLTLLGLVGLFITGNAWAQDDNFDDNLQGTAWSLIEDAPGTLDLVEQNGRLETIASPGGSANDDALYLSNGPDGFRLATDTDFVLTIDYSFTGFNGSASANFDAIGLVFGVGRDLDGTDSAAIGYGVGNLLGTFPVGSTVAHRTNDVQSASPLTIGGPATGTFTISYDASGDDLWFSDGVNSSSLDDTVVGQWGADSLYVSFGARGSGFTLTSGNAYLDNFNVVSGRVVQSVPEPSTWALLLGGALAAAVLRRRRRTTR